VTASRRLSQAISEGDGISIIATVGDAASARAAQEQGADGVSIVAGGRPVALETDLPVLYRGPIEHAAGVEADACVIDIDDIGDDEDELHRIADAARALGLELIVSVADEDELEIALDILDPEVLLLAPKDGDDDEEALEHVLDLLPDVPAGKLAIASLPASSRERIVALERAGFDAVLVGPGDVTELVGGEPPAF
jgi:indole-3-glycerol phosphate synthase